MFRLKLPKLDSSGREEIISRIFKEGTTGEGYYFLLIVSVVICMLGLLMNSSAVIIGGMIIAPLLNPIIAIGAAIIIGNEKLLIKALHVVAVSIVVAILGATLITIIIPLHEPTTEILIRTKPTLIDLIVAIAAGAVGAYAVTVRQSLMSLLGVAVASAITPPLAVIGYGLAVMSIETIVGAFLLFCANLLAVVVSTVLVFYALGFDPGRSSTSQEIAKRDFAITVVLTLLVFFILGGFFINTIKVAQRSSSIEDEVNTFLKSYDNTKVISVNENENPFGAVIEITIQSPSNFTQRAIAILDERLEQRLQEPVSLQLLVIPVTKIVD